REVSPEARLRQAVGCRCAGTLLRVGAEVGAVRLLLDTHAFVWWDNDELPRAVRDRIRSGETVYVSAVSAWEIAIKSALAKITARAALADALEDYGFEALPITVAHADAVR